MNKIVWRSPSNIALVKYWGKQHEQIPMNPSISMTLQQSYTETSIQWAKANNCDSVQVNLLFEGNKNPKFENRINKYINRITEYIPELKGHALLIESRNSFPHSSGIASSASAMSALALCLVDFEKQLTGSITGFKDAEQKASFLARIGSGSAARSIYPGFTLWGSTPTFKKASNNYAIPINNNIHSVFKDYNDAILIVSDKTKKVSSSVGHKLMDNHPYAKQKFEEAHKNNEKLLAILQHGDQNKFIEIVENEALSLHAMMMTSSPSFILMEANTISILEKVRAFRQDTGIPICFTLDAGANVHILYSNSNKTEVRNWIDKELSIHCVNKRWIDDKIGLGPMRLE